VAAIALDVQDLLWAEYNARLDQRIEGIAAMPSMHVAIPVLLAGTGGGRRALPGA
jgi:hypothetical protein